MNFFFKRIETPSDIVIIIKPHFMYVFFIGLALNMLTEQIPEISTFIGGIWLCLIIMILMRFISMRNVNNEIKEGLSRGSAVITGSKVNYKNPLTVKIAKNNKS